jgi:hypothetical protein
MRIKDGVFIVGLLKIVGRAHDVSVSRKRD